MAAGDIKDDANVVVSVLTAGAAVTKGQVVHLEADDGLWDPVVDNDKGKFAVAIEAASGTGVEFRGVLWGPVVVTATAAAINAFELAMAGSTGKITKEDWAVVGETVGTTMEAFGSGGTQLIFVGLVR